MIWTKYRIAACVAVTTVVGACSLIYETDTTQCKTTADCIKRGPSFEGLVCGPQGVCVKEGGCTTNQECIDANGGKPFICKKASRACVALQTTVADKGVECTPLADPTDIANDSTVWIGLNMSKTALPYGSAAVDLADLARSEIKTIGLGLPPLTPGGQRRPVALEFCENGGNPSTALAVANYLVKDVGVPAMLLPDDTASTQQALQVTLPAGVFSTSPAIAEMSPLDTNPLRLFWPTGTDVSVSNAVIASRVSQERLEPMIRKQLGLAESDPIKLAFISSQNQLVQQIVNTMKPALKINGKSALEDTEHAKFITYSDTDKATPAEYKDVQDQLLAFQPHLIFAISLTELGPDIIGPVEDGWPVDAKYRPFWFTGAAGLSLKLAEIAAFHAADHLATRRLLWLAPNYVNPAVKNTAATAKEQYKWPTDLDVINFGHVLAFYDAVYAISYLATANGANELTGTNLTKAMPKILPPNQPKVLAGPNTLFTGLKAAGSSGMDYDGVLATWDFDTALGVIPNVPWTSYCFDTVPVGTPAGASPYPAGTPTGIRASGLSFANTATRDLIGDIDCEPSVLPDAGAGDGG